MSSIGELKQPHSKFFLIILDDGTQKRQQVLQSLGVLFGGDFLADLPKEFWVVHRHALAHRVHVPSAEHIALIKCCQRIVAYHRVNFVIRVRGLASVARRRSHIRKIFPPRSFFPHLDLQVNLQ
jgi:hypothetical protein